MRVDIDNGFSDGLLLGFIIKVVAIVLLAHYRYHVLGFPPELDHAFNTLGAGVSAAAHWYQQRASSFVIPMPMLYWR